MLDRFPRIRARWFFVALMTMALVAVACGSDAEPAAPAPTLDIAAIQAAVQGGDPSAAFSR